MSAQRPRTTRNRLALALEPRMMFDAAAVATAAQASDQAAAQQTAADTAPSLSADAVPVSHAVTDSAVTSQPLFSNAQANSNDVEQDFAHLRITVDSVNAREALVIDGSTIALTDTPTGETSGKQYAYTVTLSGNLTTVQINLNASDSNTAQDLKALVEGIRYSSLDGSVEPGSRTVTLTQVRDEGTDNDVSNLNISATVSLTSLVNIAPELTDSGSVELAQGIGAPGMALDRAEYSTDGRYLYVAASDGRLVVYEVDANGQLSERQTLPAQGSGTINGLALSSDGRFILTGTSGNQVHTYAITEQGTVGHIQSTSFSGLRGISLSADNAHLYVVTDSGGLSVYNRDTTLGTVNTNLVQRITNLQLGTTHPELVQSIGDFVYVVSDPSHFAARDTLTVLQRNPNGSLALIPNGSLVTNEMTERAATTHGFATSADGRLLYLSDSQQGVIQVYRLGNDGLARIDLVSLANVNNLVLSADGQRLYASTSDGKIVQYQVSSSGTLNTTHTLDASGVKTLQLSPDGLSLVALGTDLNRFTTVRSYMTGSDLAIGQGMSISDINADALAAGAGDYSGFSVTVSRVGGASANDQFSFIAGNGFRVDGQRLLRDNIEVGSFVQNAGQTVLAFSAAVTRNEANAMLQQVIYNNTQDRGSVRLQMTVNDGRLDSQPRHIELLIGVNGAPTLSAASITHPVYDTANTQVTLFKDAQVNVGEPGQRITRLTLSLAGLDGVQNEYLLLDDTRIALDQSSSGTLASGMSYSYTRDGATASLVLNSTSGVSAATAQRLVNGIAYRNEHPIGMTGERSITLVSISDNGGTAAGGADTTALAISSLVNVRTGSAPQLQDSFTPDATLVYVDGKLQGSSEFVTSMRLSGDGKTLVVAGNSGTNGTGTGYLRIYARDSATGALTLLQSFTQGTSDNPDTALIEIDGLNKPSAVIFSADGNSVYVAAYVTVNSSNIGTLLAFQRDASSGELTFQGVQARQGESGVAGLNGIVSQITLSADGKFLYTVNGAGIGDTSTGAATLGIYARDAQTGALTWVSSLVDASSIPRPSGIVIAPDGLTAYVTNLSGRTLTVFSRDTSTGLLTLLHTLTPESIGSDPASAALPTTSNATNLLNANDVVISPDGRSVYISSISPAFISTFTRDPNTGRLTFAGALDVSSLGGSANSAREIALSADGEALYVTTFGGSKLLVLGRDSANGALTYLRALTLNGTANRLAVSADGLSLYTGAGFGTAATNIIRAHHALDWNQGTSNHFAAGLSLSDVDYEAAASYQGLVLTIARSGIANAADRFTFTNGNGLSRDGQRLLLNGQPVATLTEADGKLTITFGNANAATVNDIVQQIAYSAGPTAQDTLVVLTVHLNDGVKQSSRDIYLRVNQAPQSSETVPMLAKAEIGKPYQTVLPLSGFSDPNGDAITFTVQGLPSGLSFDAATGLISGTPSADSVGVYTASLVVSDSRGAQQIIARSLEVQGLASERPQLSAVTTDLVEIGQAGNSNDEGQNLLADPRDGLLSADGRFAYTLSGGDAEETDTLTVFSRDTQGQMTRVQSLGIDVVAALASAEKLLLSANQQWLYVITGDNSVLVFSRAADSGQLQLLSTLDGSTLSTNQFAIADAVQHGDSLYLAGSDGLYRLRQNPDGSLTELAHYSDFTGLSNPHRLMLSGDGQYLLASGTGGEYLLASLRISPDGTLSQAHTLALSDANLQAMVLSPDGRYLYTLDKKIIGDGNGTLLHTIALDSEGKLVLQNSQTVDADAIELAVAQNGTALFIGGGSSLFGYARSADGQISAEPRKAQFESKWTGEFRGLSLSPDGQHLHVLGGDAGISLLTLRVDATGLSVTEGEAPKLLAPSASLSDPQLDERGDYKDASLVIAREAGEIADDSFGFSDGNGLTLVDSQILRNGVAIASFSQADGKLTVQFIANLTQTDAQQILRQVTYANVSQDPVRDGNRPRMQIVLNDDVGNRAELFITVALTSVNQAPELSSNPLNPSLIGLGEPQRLFAETQVGTIETHQNIARVELVLDAANAGDVILVRGQKIHLDTAGNFTLPNGLEYQVSIDAGVTTLRLYLNGTPAQASTLIDGLAFYNTRTELSGSRTVTLQVVEVDQNDTYENLTTILTEPVRITLQRTAADNSAPILINAGLVRIYNEQGPAIAIAPAVSLSDVQSDAFYEGKGNYQGMTLTVKLNDADRLDRLAFNTGNGLSVVDGVLLKASVRIGTLTLGADTLSIHFDDDAGLAPTREDVTNALHQITYGSSDRTPASTRSFDITLDDSHQGIATLRIEMNIALFDDTPVIDPDPLLSIGEFTLTHNQPDLAGLGAITQSTLSSDGRTLLVVGATGDLAIFRLGSDGTAILLSRVAVTDGQRFEQLELTQDGRTLYAVTGNDSLERQLRIYQVDAQGQASLSQTVANSEAIGWTLSLISDLQLSSDGHQLFVKGSGLVTFNRAEDGSLSYNSHIADSLDGPPYLWGDAQMSVSGNYLVVATHFNDGRALIVYRRTDSGSLELVTHEYQKADKPVLALDGLLKATLAGDRQSLYVLTASGVTRLHLDTSSKTLSLRDSLTKTGIKDMVLANDGKSFVVTLDDGSLTRYSTIDGLRQAERFNASDVSAAGTATQALPGPDGRIIVTGQGLAVFDTQGVATPRFVPGSEPVVITPALRFDDSEMSAKNGGEGDYNGATLTVKRLFTSQSTDQYGLAGSGGFSVAGETVNLDGAAVATLQNANGVMTLRVTGALTTAQFNALARQITYASTLANVQHGSIALTVTLNDGANNSSMAQAGVIIGAAEVPVDPGVPVEPEVPVDPGTPVDPEVPVTPGTPVDPEVPVDPGTPVDPQVPVVPETPTAPVLDPVAPVVLAETSQQQWANEPQPGESAQRLLSAEPTETAAASGTTVQRQTDEAVAEFNHVSEDIAGLSNPDDPTEQASERWEVRLGNPLLAIDPLQQGVSAPRAEVVLLAAPAAAGQTLIKLPDGLLVSRDGRIAVSVRLANGLPLPGWIRFDPVRGELKVDSRQLARFGQIDLQLRGQDANGNQATVRLQVRSSAGEPQADVSTAGAAGFSEQLQSQSGGWMAQAQQLLVAVLGQR